MTVDPNTARESAIWLDKRAEIYWDSDFSAAATIIRDQSAEIARLTAERDAARADFQEAAAWIVETKADLDAAYADGIEAAAKACEQQESDFLAPEYACPQPVGSITERFACRQCATAIRALPIPPRGDAP